ncbi:L-type lectin-domain containing receptor kinase S.1 [Morella rubra]|uniref:L-type lectin-domain containing receptor kinase S.1 n=1 Tax=Morella rubra TaxID=262757 RepID=A0A6A1WDR5_9ROSI|nr:L-type lectin-domain containing receptor kinase S.1 [Morella rubra]
MQGRLGDYGLAKLYQHGEELNTTRVIGTLGYSELARVVVPTSSSDVCNNGVVILEVGVREETNRAGGVTGGGGSDRLGEGALREREGGSSGRHPSIKVQYEAGEMELLLKFGLASCHQDLQRRPTMKEAVVLLVGKQAHPKNYQNFERVRTKLYQKDLMHVPSTSSF